MIEITGYKFQRSCPEFMREICTGTVGLVQAMNGRWANKPVRTISLTLVKGELGKAYETGTSDAPLTLSDGSVETSVSMRDAKGGGVKGMIKLISDGKKYVHYREGYNLPAKVFLMEVVDV